MVIKLDAALTATFDLLVWSTSYATSVTSNKIIQTSLTSDFWNGGQSLVSFVSIQANGQLTGLMKPMGSMKTTLAWFLITVLYLLYIWLAIWLLRRQLRCSVDSCHGWLAVSQWSTLLLSLQRRSCTLVLGSRPHHSSVMQLTATRGWARVASCSHVTDQRSADSTTRTGKPMVSRCLIGRDCWWSN